MLQIMFDRMLQYYEHRPAQEWWPDDPLEVMIGAILVQGTTWKNVSRILDELKAAALLDVQALHALDAAELQERIRTAGFQQQKAPAIKKLMEFLVQQFDGNLYPFLSQDSDTLSGQLLAIKGIGRQMTENILLYAANRVVYAVDKYTSRIFLRHGIIGKRAREPDIQRIVDQAFGLAFEKAEEKETARYSDFQALLVRIGRDFCAKTKPQCRRCPLESLLPEGGPLEAHFESSSQRMFSQTPTTASPRPAVPRTLTPPPLPPKPAPKPVEELDLSDAEQKVLALIQYGGTPIDAVIVQSGLPTGQVLATLAALEMRRLIRRKEGNMVERK